jgi:hyperosmotically inducible periplasmic protein
MGNSEAERAANLHAGLKRSSRALYVAAPRLPVATPRQEKTMRNTRAIPHSILASALSIGLLFAAGQALASQQAQSAEKEEQARTESSQPGEDTWITTKVKAALLADEDVAGTDIKVETDNGVVKLSGKVNSKDQIDKAVAVAEGLDGVKKVDKSGLSVGKD